MLSEYLTLPKSQDFIILVTGNFIFSDVYDIVKHKALNYIIYKNINKRERNEKKQDKESL